jgi:hypothetical protein
VRPPALAALAALAAAAGCAGSEPLLADAVKVERARIYLGSLAPVLVSRPLTADEVAAIEASVDEHGDAQPAIDAIVTGWTAEPALAEAARELVQTRLAVSGSRDGIDFELPGNLAAKTVVDDLPWSTLLTADYCVGADLQPIECDSGAPYVAGLLTTRAYLAGRASRFNLTRASTMMNTFACHHYPMPESFEPKVPRERLRAMFRADTPEEQEDPTAADAFGNGFACYACHGQFAPHAQLFVQFDESGVFRADATGLQDPAGELGRSTGGLFASHFEDPDEARSPAAQMLGQPVATLVEAGQVLAQSPEFTRCMARNVLEYGIGLEPGTDVDPALLDDLGATLGAPTQARFADFVIAVFTHPRVVDAVVTSLYAPAKE